MALPLPLLGLIGLAGAAALFGGGAKPANAATAPHPGPGLPGTTPLPPAPGGAGSPNPWGEKGMSPQTVQAVQTALAIETDPKKLRAFAATLDQEGFHKAAAALVAKAVGLEAGALAAQAAQAAQAQGANPVQAAQAAAQAVAQYTAPAAAPSPLTPGLPYVVTTHDTGPSGDLNVRAMPDANAQAVGAVHHGAMVMVTGPAQNGFFPLAVPHGWASAAYLTPAAQAAAQGVQPAPGMPPTPDLNSLLQSLPMPSVPGLPPSLPNLLGNALGQPVAYAPAASPYKGLPYTVTTHDTGPSGNLNVRAAADANSTAVGSNPHGGTVYVTGPAQNGFLPIASPGGIGWSSAAYLTPQASSVSAGFVAPNDVGTGPSTAWSELQDAALALKTALDTQGCRSYNEPLVKRFQAVARAAGLYTRSLDGWYDTQTQAALAKVVGAPAPPCFPTPAGGPKNPNQYWSPIGT